MTAAKLKRVTIKDVAREAGVSLSTVSGVLNGINEFSEQTKKKIWDAAHSLNYIPNSQARQLRAGNSIHEKRKTGVIIHISHLGGETPVGNLVEAQRSQIISWEAAKLGMYPISYWYYHLKGFQCPPVLDGTVDGAIVGTPHIEVVSILRNKLPMVLMDVPFSIGNADVPMVNMDIRHGINQLLNKLCQSGHRKIGMMYSSYLTDTKYSLEITIMNMFKESSNLYNVEILPTATISEKIYPENHEKIMETIAMKFEPLIKKKDITAIVCPNTVYAETLCEVFRKINIKVPDDVSIIGGIYFGFEIPPLGICSMLYNWPQLIKTSLNVLNELIGKKTPICLNYLIKPEIYLGASVKIIK